MSNTEQELQQEHINTTLSSELAFIADESSSSSTYLKDNQKPLQKFKNTYNIKDMLCVSFSILKEMLSDRNIGIDEINNISNAELLQFYEEKDNPIFDIKISPTFRVIYYLSTVSMKTKDLILIDKEKDKNVILILRDKLSSNTLKEIKKTNKVDIECFLITDLLFNPYRHELVPKHELITDKDEKIKILQSYYLKNPQQLPHIKRSIDPICKYLNIKLGTIVKITRPSLTSGEYISYRYCT